MCQVRGPKQQLFNILIIIIFNNSAIFRHRHPGIKIESILWI